MIDEPTVLQHAADRRERVLTAAPPMGNADETILFKCAHIEFVGGDTFDSSAVSAKPRGFIFLRGGVADSVA